MSHRSDCHWAIITGEYPPMPGGVADYTALIARGLNDRGARVDVWTSSHCKDPLRQAGVNVQSLSDHFGRAGLAVLLDQIGELPIGTRVLVQYVPHAFSARSMNLPFCAAVAKLAQRFKVDVMFHEVAMPMGRRLPIKWNIAGAVHRMMARMLVASADRVLASTAAWTPLLQPMCRKDQPILLCPVPSNIPQCEDSTAVEALRAEHGTKMFGHFGTAHDWVRDQLLHAVEAILEDDAAKFVFIGRGSSTAGRWIADRLPHRRGRIVVTGPLGGEAVAAHISACSVMLIPFVDGVTTRRTSAMAALAAGVPLVTTRGELTEDIWTELAAACLIPVDQTADLAKFALAIGGDEDVRGALGRCGKMVYDQHFSLARTLDTLCSTS